MGKFVSELCIHIIVHTCNWLECKNIFIAWSHSKKKVINIALNISELPCMIQLRAYNV